MLEHVKSQRRGQTRAIGSGYPYLISFSTVCPVFNRVKTGRRTVKVDETRHRGDIPRPWPCRGPRQIDRPLAKSSPGQRISFTSGRDERQNKENFQITIMVDRSLSSHAVGVADRPTSFQVPRREMERLTATPDSGIVAELRRKISSGELGRDPLPHIIEAALSITGAHGAAIAMRQDNSVFCTARAGSMAPDLGSELSPHSGISGQCLRTGRALRCDDTTIDPRVDAEASRRMGLRSIAVAPLGQGPTVSGILEAFSPKPYAFSDTHMELLVELADLVMAPQAARSESVLLKTRQKLAAAAKNWKIALPTAAVLVFVGWLSFRSKAPVSNSSNALAHPARGAVASIPADEPPVALTKPAPGVRAVRPKASLPGGVVMASASEKMRGESALRSKPQTAALENADDSAPNPNHRSPAVGNPVEQVSTAPPLAAVSPGADAMLAEILSPSSAIPVLPSMRLSQGLSGGRIERRVDPIYPQQAIRARIEGRVVMRVLVAEDGNVRDVKVVDGSLLFNQAAKDAVAKWHFQPFRLNGQPIQMTTEIILNFKLP